MLPYYEIQEFDFDHDFRMFLLEEAKNTNYLVYNINDPLDVHVRGILERPWIDNFWNIFNFKTDYAVFLKVPANGKIPIHIDDHSENVRKTVVAWGLTDDWTTFAPTNWYTKDQETLVDVVNYDTRPVILNTREYHEVVNLYNVDRYSIQFTVNMEIDQVCDTLFKHRSFQNLNYK